MMYGSHLMYMTRRRGIAVPLVLVFAAILLITGIFILRNTQQHAAQNRTSLAQLQGHFLARAGLEHALLKVKYLHRELYDAACLLQGRNPLFDYSRASPTDPGDLGISSQNPGPVFLYYENEAAPNRFFTPNFLTVVPSAGQWLDTFRQDIGSSVTTSDGVILNSVLSCSPLPSNLFNLMKEPFTGQVVCSDINLLAHHVDDAKSGGADPIVKNQAIVEIVVDADITTARGEIWRQQMRKTVRVARDYRD